MARAERDYHRFEEYIIASIWVPEGAAQGDRSMGAISDEFERELAALRERYAADPHQELIQLCLLSLEREGLVSVAYREDRMEARLRTMPLSEEARELLLHALVWAWKDEEMHATYVRGLLFRLGRPVLRGRALFQQRLGAIAGWAGSVRHHVRPTQAPVSWACATAITTAGRLLGKVPEDVGKYLDYGPFRDFCAFNVHAERTAWLCWKRMRELVAELPGLPAHLEQDFRQVEDDEARHERIFFRAEHTFLPPGVRLSPELRRHFWERFRRPEVRRFLVWRCAGYQGTLNRLPDLYPGIRVPSLVLWGERDRHFPLGHWAIGPLGHAHRLHAAIPDAHLEVIPGGEHWMPWHAAPRVAAALRNFLAPAPAIRSRAAGAGRAVG